ARLGPVSTGEQSSSDAGTPGSTRDAGLASVIPPIGGGQTARTGAAAAYHRAMPTLRVALVQLEARDDVEANLARAAALPDAAADGADLVVLPEYVQFRGSDPGFRASARELPGATTAPFAAIARERGCWLLAGSHAEASGDPDRPFNTALLFDRRGELAARYRKLH